MYKSILNGLLLVAVLGTLSACSSTPKPKTELALSNAALQNAEVAGAQTHAPIELRQAREKQAQADGAMASKNYNTARQLSEQAEVDAQLAKAKSEAEKSRLAIKETDESIQLIRTELDRTGAQ